MRRARRTQGGFTLIELMVAMALSTVGLLGLLALQMIAINGNMMSRNFGEAIGIAQQRLEVAEHTPFASLSTLAESSTAKIDPTTDLQNLTSTSAIYSRATTVTANGDNTTDVSVTVTWQDPRNNSHSVTLLTKRSP